MFRDALGYPTRSPEGGRSIILGGLAVLSVTLCFGIAALEEPYAYFAVIGVVPWILLRGYYVRVIGATIGRDRPTPPRFNDVRRLFSDGAIAVSISVVYLLPGVLVLAPLVAAQAFEVDLSEFLVSIGIPDSATTVLIPTIGLFAVVAAMALLGALYVLPVAVGRFAHSGRWRDAFGIRTVVNGAMTEDYVIAWGVSLLLQVVLLPFVYSLRILLVGFFLHFVVMVGVRYCYGQGIGAALDLEPIGRQDDSDDRDAVGRPDPTPAFVRVGTDRWGVSPGRDPDPMSKVDPSDDRTEPNADGGERGGDPDPDSDEPTLRPAVRRIPEDDR